MKKLVIAFAAILMVSSAAYAGPVCEGDPNDVDNPSACGPCVVTPSGESTAGCIALAGNPDPGAICIGGDATNGQGCAAIHDGSAANGVFICNTPAGPAQCTAAQCRAAAQAACEAAQ